MMIYYQLIEEYYKLILYVIHILYQYLYINIIEDELMQKLFSHISFISLL